MSIHDDMPNFYRMGADKQDALLACLHRVHDAILAEDQDAMRSYYEQLNDLIIPELQEGEWDEDDHPEANK